MCHTHAKEWEYLDMDTHSQNIAPCAVRGHACVQGVLWGGLRNADEGIGARANEGGHRTRRGGSVGARCWGVAAKDGVRGCAGGAGLRSPARGAGCAAVRRAGFARIRAGQSAPGSALSSRSDDTSRFLGGFEQIFRVA